MKKNILIISVVVGLLMVLSCSMSEAAFIADSPFTSSYLEVIPNFDGFGNTAVITFESTDVSETTYGSYFAVLLDRFGSPTATSATFFYFYLFADILSDGSLDIYGSDTGFNTDWHFIGNF